MVPDVASSDTVQTQGEERSRHRLPLAARVMNGRCSADRPAVCEGAEALLKERINVCSLPSALQLWSTVTVAGAGTLALIARRSIQRLGTGALAGWLVLAGHSGCMPDLEHLAAGNAEGSGGSIGDGTTNSGGTGAAGSSGSGGGSDTGGRSGSGGMSAGGTSSSTGGNTSTEGAGGSNGGGMGTEVTSGMAGAGGVTCEDQGLTSCADETGCFDLAVGTPDDQTVTHCGICGLKCSLDNATGTECSEGQCRPVCETGFYDCNAELAATEAQTQAEAAPPTDDGCETDITTVQDCGACGYACSKSGATETSCRESRCQPSCLPHFGDCNASDSLTSDDGCETYLESITSCRANCAAAAVACEPGQVCTAGACGDPQGIAVFSVPLTESGQVMRYSDIFPVGTDLVGTTFHVRIYAPGATEGVLVSYFSSFNSAFGGGGNFPLSFFAGGWKEIRLPVGNKSGDYDPADIKQLNFEIQAGNASSWEPNPVIIYVDAIRSSNGSVNDSFDDDVDGMVPSGFLVIPGSTLSWTDSLPE